MKKFNILQRTAYFIACSKKTFRIMKLSIFLLFVTVFNLFGSITYSQNARLNLDMRDVPIKTVLNAIENQSEFFFLYSSKMINIDQKVDINVTDEKITDVLDELLAHTDIKYAVRDRQILLVNKEAEAAMALQQKKVTGTIIDKDKQPVIGANVVVKGTQIGAITDADGKYSIDVPLSGGTLVVSFIGFTSQEVEVGNNTVVDITLQTEAMSLDEVVVVGYGTVLKKNITTSVSKVSVDNVPKASSSNMTQLLLGRASGLQATVASAQPGGNVNISIRGAEAPIYVIDGIVMPSNSLEGGSGGTVTVVPSNVNRGGLAGLNPEDIESVEILKDASASIYGIGASRGVILVTTKKGKEGPLKVNYDGSYSVVNNYPYPNALDARQYMGLVNIFNKEQYLYQNNLAPYGPTAYTTGWSAPYDDATIAAATSTDWKNQVLRKGSVSNHNLVLNGGNKTVSYYVSGNYYSQTGSVSNSSMDRYAIRSNVGIQLNSFIKLTSVINANRNNYNNSTVGGTSNGRGAQAAGALTAAMTYPSTLPIKDANGIYTVFLNVPNAVSMENMLDRTYTNGVYLNFAADFTIIKNMLTARALFGDNFENSRRTTFIPSTVYFDQMYKSRGNLGTDSRENQTMEATVAFTKKLGTLVNVDAVVGMGRYVNKYNGMNVSYDGQHDAIANDNLGAITGVILPGSYTGQDEKRSQFARLNFDILDRYVIASTLRRDGTDKFFPAKKYAFFPSVSFAWKISNESFLKGVAWMNLVKVRASYGETGSDNLGTLLYGSFGPYVNQIMFNQNSVKYIPIIANGLDYPNVSWEKTTMKNVGLDFSIFRDKVSGSLDLFMNDVTDMLANANTSGLSMFGTYPINGGHIRRQGWDANISTKNVQTQNFTWTSILTLSRYNSLWMSRMPNYDYNTYEKKGVVGSNVQYYYETSGIINADKSNMPSSQPLAGQKPGYPIIVDQDGNDTINIKDIKMRNLVPTIYFGFGNTFTYKNFDLDIFMYSQLGVRKYNYALDWAYPVGLANQTGNQNQYSYRMWNSQTNTNGTLPGIAYNLASVTLPGGAGTDLNYQNSSFVRVRNITLGYNITSKMLGGASRFISSIRIYLDAQNPLTFTNFEGYDPEVISGGGYKGGKAEYPQIRTYTAGVKVSF